MIGMKITQVASVDMRLGGLEDRMACLERVVEQLYHTVPGFKTPLFAPKPTSSPVSNAYPTEASDLGIISDSPDTQPQDLSFDGAPTYVGSDYPPSSSATQTGSLAATAPLAEATHMAENRSSDSTVRGRDHEDTLIPTQALLTRQLDAERLARRALEVQVAKLSQRLNTLSATMYAMVRSKSQEHLRPPTPSSDRRTKGPSPPYDRDESDLTMTGDDYDEERQTEEEFLTPEGRSTLGYSPGTRLGYSRFVDDEPKEYDEDFGSEVEDMGNTEDEAKRKKALRTLSLGQLTLGKGANQQQIQV
jgi:hypothetical protein